MLRLASGFTFIQTQFSMDDFFRLFDIPYYQLQKFGKPDALAAKENSNWKKYSSQDFVTQMNLVSAAALQNGLKPGDTIAMVSGNRPEWNFVDMGMMQMGVVNVPVYPTISEDDYIYIFNDAEVKMVFVSNEELHAKVMAIKSKVPSLQKIISFNPIKGVLSFSDFIAVNANEDVLEKIKSISESIHENDLACLIYTSGTTGFPKGVMLSHKNVVSNIKNSAAYVPVGLGDVALSFLPLNHSFEKMVTYLYMAHGVSIYYSEHLDNLGEIIKEVKPNVFTAVPRLIEKVFEKIMSKGMELHGLKKALFFWAVSLGEKFDTQNNFSLWYRLQLAIANKLIFSKWREALGNNLKLIVSGAAALQPRINRIFWSAKIPILEGYGLTETSPVISVNHLNPAETKIGTVGMPIDHVHVKIADDGEILFKGDNVMLGYFKKPDATNEMIDSQGWLHTGDVGEISNGYLKITDRKKELFKTSGGKYVAPQTIENKLKESYLIEQAMVIGDQQKFVTALIVLSADNLKSWCTKNNIVFTTIKDMIKHKLVLQKVEEVIAEKNNSLGHVEQIKKFQLVADEWTPQNGFLTPTMKLKRKLLINHYAKEIELMYKD